MPWQFSEEKGNLSNTPSFVLLDFFFFPFSFPWFLSVAEQQQYQRLRRKGLPGAPCPLRSTGFPFAEMSRISSGATQLWAQQFFQNQRQQVSASLMADPCSHSGASISSSTQKCMASLPVSTAPTPGSEPVKTSRDAAWSESECLSETKALAWTVTSAVTLS